VIAAGTIDHPYRRLSASALLAGVRTGDLRTLASAISMVENGAMETAKLLAASRLRARDDRLAGGCDRIGTVGHRHLFIQSESTVAVLLETVGDCDPQQPGPPKAAE
jgi:hypothetical protein